LTSLAALPVGAAVAEVPAGVAGAAFRAYAFGGTASLAMGATTSADWLGFDGAFGPTADRLTGLVIPPGTGVAGFSVQRLIAVSLRDAYADPRFFRQIDAFTGYTTRSLVSLPLCVEGVVYGCVELINSPSPTGFTREEIADVDLLTTVLAARLSQEPIPTPPSTTR
jgi:GAF domain-containing protein